MKWTLCVVAAKELSHLSVCMAAFATAVVMHPSWCSCEMHCVSCISQDKMQGLKAKTVPGSRRQVCRELEGSKICCENETVEGEQPIEKASQSCLCRNTGGVKTLRSVFTGSWDTWKRSLLSRTAGDMKHKGTLCRQVRMRGHADRLHY